MNIRNNNEPVAYLSRLDLIHHPAFAILCLDVDSGSLPIVWRNGYVCEVCDVGWEDDWSCHCDDNCPSCGKSIEPVTWEWIGPKDQFAKALWDRLPETPPPSTSLDEHPATGIEATADLPPQERPMHQAPETVRDAWNMICPSCKQDDRIDITATVNVRLCPDGTDAYEAANNGHTWDSNSAASCAGCGWEGTVKDTETASLSSASAPSI